MIEANEGSGGEEEEEGEGLHLHPPPHYNVTVNFVYIAAILTGIGGTTLLVTSLSMVADLIGKYSVSVQ